MRSLINSISALALIVFLSGCGGSSGSGGTPNGGQTKPGSQQYVSWESVSSEFNPRIDELRFQTVSIEKIYVDAFGFDRDVRVVYDPRLGINEGILKIYKVFKNRASSGSMQPRANGRNLELKNYGSYQCSIRVQNMQITELDGGCYVRVEIILPQGAEIEVYNVGRLITQRFIPMDNLSFLKALDRATWADEKFAVIEGFLSSYTGNRRPSLTSQEMGQVVEEFIRSEEKFRALRRLHEFVYDRENLPAMIEDVFSYFDRPEARRIVGLG